MQTMTATLFSHLNEQRYKFSMITTGISSHVRYLMEEKGVWLLSLSLFWSEDLYENIQAMVCFFYLSSKRNQKFKHLVHTKPMGENTITNIMKVSVPGTSLKESEDKVYESLCKKNNSQQAEESKDCKFRTYRQCHRPQR